MPYLPIYLRIQNRPCLVVGGGVVALRKTILLKRAGAEVTVMAPSFHPDFQPMAGSDSVTLLEKHFDPADLKNQILVIAATDNTKLNTSITEHCRERGIPANAVDQPENCDFIFPAIIDRSPVIIAVSSSGRAPVLTRLLKAKLEKLLSSHLGQLAELAGHFRNQVKEAIKSPTQRRRFWERMLGGAPGELMLAGQTEAASLAMESALKAADSDCQPLTGYVALVGAGPGDPDLLTFRAYQLIQEADVVVYDRLVSQAVLQMIRQDAEKIYVGKARADHTLSQEEINGLLARLAREGKRVVRLKGGDPFIFGRGGEEIDTLSEEGIPFMVVPGITAASGCASYAGIPLTHRDYAQSCLFVTGHRQGDSTHLDWNKLVVPRQTLVIYMGLLGLEEICRALIHHGMPAEMPAALIQSGTNSNQKVIIATTGTLAEKARNEGAAPPTLVIIGEVVKLHAKLAWFRGYP